MLASTAVSKMFYYLIVQSTIFNIVKGLVAHLWIITIYPHHRSCSREQY